MCRHASGMHGWHIHGALVQAQTQLPDCKLLHMYPCTRLERRHRKTGRRLLGLGRKHRRSMNRVSDAALGGTGVPACQCPRKPRPVCEPDEQELGLVWRL